ncbi:MAG TPA: Ig-like domain-containing protein, partial [Desertimonas sp.]|nr:Ig-like domain-containing protein [Desertimonas sp.]
GQFEFPRGIAVAPNGNVYVADTNQHRIQRFTSNGGFLGAWGAVGSSDGQFQNPFGVSVAPDGNIFVADANNHRIQRFTATGDFVDTWASRGTGDGQVQLPIDVSVAADGSVYIVDFGNSRIQRFAEGAGATLTYTPNPNYHGPDSFKVEVTDRGDPDNCGVPSVICDAAASDDETVLVTVNPVNDAPVAVDDAATTDQDVAVDVDVLANDLDVDGDTLAVASFVQGANGTVELVAGKLRYTPDAGFSGTDSFTYRASDGSAESNLATVAITVADTNDPPDAVDDEATTAEDTPSDVDVLANDTDADGDPLTITDFTSPENGTVMLVAGSLRFTPAANFHGSDSFTYTISDGRGGSDTAAVEITVTAVNDAPAAFDDAKTTAEDMTLIASVPAGADVDGDALTYELENDTVGLVFNSDGSYTYTPPADFNGSASFTYRANDGVADSNVATVTITVTPVNDPPSAEDASVTTPEDTPVELVFAGSDVDGDELTFEVVGGPEHGTLVGTTYTPALDYHGPDSITFRASDGTLTDDAVVTISVTPVNDPPVAFDDAATTDQDVAVDVDVLAHDLDVDGNALAVSSFGQGDNGTVALVGGTLRYTPAAGFSGSDSFTYQASDGSALSNSATVAITVHATANAAPDAVDDEATTAEDTPTNVDVLANDTDADVDPLTISNLTQPSNGVVSENADHTLHYVPAADFHGSDSFTYTISDGQGGTDTATVTIIVTAVNDAPVAFDDAKVTAEDSTLNASLPAATDVDGDTLTYTLELGTAGLSFNPDGSYSYVPPADFNGSASFTYRATDGSLSSNLATVTITVTPINDPPTLTVNPTALTMDEDAAAQPVTVTGADKETTADNLAFKVTQAPAHGTLRQGTTTLTPGSMFAVAGTAGTFLGKWGSPGFGDGQFSNPHGVAVAPDGSVYVADADSNNPRIQRFAASGAFLGKWGSVGSIVGQFKSPWGVAVAPDGSVYVADSNNHRIQRFTASGDFLGTWGEGQFNRPLGVAVAPDSSVYVADANNQIQRFTASGAFLGKWGSVG